MEATAACFRAVSPTAERTARVLRRLPTNRPAPSADVHELSFKEDREGGTLEFRPGTLRYGQRHVDVRGPRTWGAVLTHLPSGPASARLRFVSAYCRCAARSSSMGTREDCRPSASGAADRVRARGTAIAHPSGPSSSAITMMTCRWGAALILIAACTGRQAPRAEVAAQDAPQR